jgi:hypothetical protein
LPSAGTAQESTKNTTISAALAQNTTFVTPAMLCIRARCLVVGSRASRLIGCSYPTPVVSCHISILILGAEWGIARTAYFLTIRDGAKSPESAVDRNRPIGADVFYLFCLVLFLSVAALSAPSLRAALRDADEERAWISAAYFAIASLLAIVFWRLSSWS